MLLCSKSAGEAENQTVIRLEAKPVRSDWLPPETPGGMTLGEEVCHDACYEGMCWGHVGLQQYRHRPA